MPKHIKIQTATGETTIPGASKARLSRLSPNTDGRIIRVRLHDTDYLTYSPGLLSALTQWHNLYGGACQHGDPLHSPWPCGSCRYRPYTAGDASRRFKNAIERPARKIALVPWPKTPPGSKWKYLQEQEVKLENWRAQAALAASARIERKRMRNQDRFGEEKSSHELSEKEERGRWKKKKLPVAKRNQGKDPKTLRFAHADLLPGRDDPVEHGRDMALAGDLLPSDGMWRVGNSRGSGVRLGTEEEKDLADLRKQGLLKDVEGQDVLTLDSIAREDEPVYRVRFVQKKKKAGKRTGGIEVIQTPERLSEEQVSDSSSDIVAQGEEAAEGVDPTLELLSQEIIDAMPDHCWAGFFADLEAEGWVPVIEDDLTSVAESWVVMESESEDSDENT